MRTALSLSLWLLMGAYGLSACSGGDDETADVEQTDVSDVTDASDVSDSTDASDASDSTDTSDTSDVTDASDTSDVTDASDASDASDSTDASDTSDASDATDASNATDPTDPTDTGTTYPRPGFGDLSGECGVMLEPASRVAGPWLIANRLDFGMNPYDDGDLELLTDGGQEVVSDGNAGGSSLLSEVFAFEVLSRCEDAILLKTETEIVYTDVSGKKTDLVVTIGGIKWGVSVTRAVGYPRDAPYTVERAADLLEQKLSGVIASTANVAEEDAWTRQILHVIAYDTEHLESLQTAFEALDDTVRSDTVVWVTVSDGDDEFLY